MFRDLFGGGAAANALADVPPSSSPLDAAHVRPGEDDGDGGQDEDGPVDYAPPPLDVIDERFGDGAAAAPAPSWATKTSPSAGSLGGEHGEDSAERGGGGGGVIKRPPSFVWAPAAGPPAGGDGDAARSAWLAGDGAAADAAAGPTAHDRDGGEAGPVVVRVPSAALARRLSRHSAQLGADFRRRASSANFARLGGTDHAGHSSWPTAACHLVTAMVGAGILALPRAFSWLGWLGGPICLMFFFAVTLFCLLHLVCAHHVGNVRHHCYADAVLHLCGRRHAAVLAASQRSNMLLTAVGYVIVGGRSAAFLGKAAGQLQLAAGGGAPSLLAESAASQWRMTLVFGCVQVAMSQLPNLEAASWSSAVGAGEWLILFFLLLLARRPFLPHACVCPGEEEENGGARETSRLSAAGSEIAGGGRHRPPAEFLITPSSHTTRPEKNTGMSVTYGVIAIALGAMGAGNRLGTLAGRPGEGPLDRAFNVCSSLGNVAFAFSAAIICIEVQHTLREPPRAVVSMRKAVGASLSTGLALYALVAGLGYAAIGDAVSDDVLTDFERVDFAPLWLAMVANAAVLLHMVSAVQVYLQPIFEWLEDALLARFPRAAGRASPVALRIALRTPLVLAITAVAVALPSFSSITGIVGAATYYPTAVAYPLMMYSNSHVVSKRRALLFRAIHVTLVLVSAAALVGAVNGLVETARQSFTAFGA